MTAQEFTEHVCRRARRRTLVITVLLIILFAAGGFCLIYDRALATVTVPGGTVRLLRATEGRLVYQKSDYVPKWIRRKIPFVNKLIPPVSAVNIDTDTMFGYVSDGPWILIDVVRDPKRSSAVLNFQRIEMDSGGHTFVGKSESNGLFRCEAVPRRDPRLRIRLISMADEKATIEIDNPFFRPEFQEWTAGPFPHVQNQGPFTVELRDIIPGPQGGAHALINCTCSDPNLLPISSMAKLEDATGNHGPWISPYEPVWKVVTSVSVPDKSPTNLKTVYPLGSIQIPPPNTVVNWKKTLDCRDAILKTEFLLGPGQYEFANDEWKPVPKSNGTVCLEGPALICRQFRLRYHSPSVDVHMQSTASNATLRFGHLSWMNNKGSYLSFGQLPPDQVLQLDLVIPRFERIEFLVKPPEKFKRSPDHNTSQQ